MWFSIKEHTWKFIIMDIFSYEWFSLLPFPRCRWLLTSFRKLTFQNIVRSWSKLTITPFLTCFENCTSNLRNRVTFWCLCSRRLWRRFLEKAKQLLLIKRVFIILSRSCKSCLQHICCMPLTANLELTILKISLQMYWIFLKMKIFITEWS